MDRNDLNQLKGILEQFEPEVVVQAVAAFLGAESAEDLRKIIPDSLDSIGESGMISRAYSDFPDPGPEVQAENEGSVVEFSGLSILERIIGENNLLPVHFLEKGSVVQRAVARVALKNGSGWASGFMVSPTLFLTNNHVIPEKLSASHLEAQFQYQLDFDGSNKTVDTYQFDTNDIFRTNKALDYTLIRLKEKSIFSFVHSAFMSEAVGESSVRRWRNAGEVYGFIPLSSDVVYAEDQHVNIIQHPAGRRKEVALQKNNIKHIYENHIRYTADTEGGSSGSPVFNNLWELITLHHAGGERRDGVWINNQGVRIDKIVADIRNHYGSGHAVVTELGI